ncbi:NADase-type glycan-binding domain-containing protein [Anaeromyxobacter oryzisoli]|uniref:NADase-type glycan-binding domain-containing protein n=1 Tax=Anaeromyxobacter oryzisoli TaxID=2925408 RepID=UPI001F566D0D|nr:hypothetical protein [Anaeromyxobacter sp. SG63]
MCRAHLLLFTLGACLAGDAALANGGGYAFGVTFTGAVSPFQASGTEHVRIVDEKLDVTLRRDAATVVVRYAMQNAANAPVRVRFGFPVEAVVGDEWGGDGGDEITDPAQRGEALRAAIQQLEGYAVTLEGKPVAARFEIEPFAGGKIPSFPGSDALKGVAGWMVSEVTFPVGAPVALEIRYTARYHGQGTFVSDDVSASALSFRYRLSTGAVWHGSIAKGTVTIRADGIAADEVEIESPRERFRRDGDRWRWTFQDLEPTLADDLTIHAVQGYDSQYVYDPEARARGIRGYLRRRGTWGEGHQRFEARASSTLAPNRKHGFGAEHLAEEASEVPWAEGAPGDGLGEWVELRPTRPAPLLALEITPGFASVPGLFKANGRPSRIEILLNGEHRFVATLGDSPTPQLVPVVGYAKAVSSVKITILEARPGARYPDTCISRVVLYDRLAHEPAHHGAR